MSLWIRIYPGSSKSALQLNSTWPIRVIDEIILNYKLKYSFFKFQPLLSNQTPSPHILKHLHDLLHRCPQFHSSHVMSRQMQAFNVSRSVTEERRQSVGTQTAWGPHLFGGPRLLIQYIPSYSPLWRPFLYTQPEVATYRGHRDPLITVYTHNALANKIYLLKVLKNMEIYVTDNMAFGLNRQQSKGLSTSFRASFAQFNVLSHMSAICLYMLLFLRFLCRMHNKSKTNNTISHQEQHTRILFWWFKAC